MLNELFLSQLEKEMMEKGFESLKMDDKNSLISQLANKNGMMYSQITPEYILNHHKKLKTSKFSELCETEITNGFTASNGHIYRTNRDDQKNFFGKALELLLVPTMTEVFWKTEDSGYIVHTREEWIAVFIEGVAHKEGKLTKYNTLKAQVRNSPSETDLLTINW